MAADSRESVLASISVREATSASQCTSTLLHPHSQPVEASQHSTMPISLHQPHGHKPSQFSGRRRPNAQLTEHHGPSCSIDVHSQHTDAWIIQETVRF